MWITPYKLCGVPVISHRNPNIPQSRFFTMSAKQVVQLATLGMANKLQTNINLATLTECSAREEQASFGAVLTCTCGTVWATTELWLWEVNDAHLNFVSQFAMNADMLLK